MGRIGSIPILIHWSWLIIAGVLTASFRAWLLAGNPELAPASAWLLAAFGALVFFCSILMHELAHAFVSRARGIEVNGITLFIFGGATDADASSRSAGDEFMIAIAGPLTSVIMAGGLGLASLVNGNEALTGLLGYLAVVNLILAAFNMAPGLPLDGGRVFRSIVWAITGQYAKATKWATTAGVAVGYLLIWGGLISVWAGSIGGLWLAAIGWMISQSARTTGQQEQLRSAFADVEAEQVMTTPVVSIPAGFAIADALDDYVRRSSRTVYPVTDDNGGIVGIVDLRQITGLTQEQIQSATIGDLARAADPCLIFQTSTPMVQVIEALAGSKHGDRALIVEHGRLAGIISAADLVRKSTLVELLRLAEPSTARPSTSR